MDLGLSSMQLDLPGRGFSYLSTGPLDMRMDSDGDKTVADLLNEIDLAGLTTLLAELGELRRPRSLARAILRRRDAGELATTADLRAAVEPRLPAGKAFPELSRIFQALRIAVNGELDALDTALATLPELLGPGGRVVIISYHSLEDRRVKNHMKRESSDCLCPPGLPTCVCGHERRYRVLTRRPMRPGAEEQNRNPRSRSARLRAAERLES